MHQSCVNNGGRASLVRLDTVPQLDEETPLSAEALQALSLWQARAGEVLTVIDPQLISYRARLTRLDQGSASCVPFQRLAKPAESSLHLEVYLPLQDKEPFERTLQQLTELGVNRIVPIESQHPPTLGGHDFIDKGARLWSEVIRDASRHCRRAMLPELLEGHTFSESLGCAGAAELKLLLSESQASWSLTEGFGSLKPQSVALLVGPEGGLSQEELKQAQAEGFLPVSLGPRFLRTETTAIIAAALVQSHLGDLG